MTTDTGVIGMDHAAMEIFLNDLKHDILALHVSLGTLESAWHVMITRTQGDMPVAFAESSALWCRKMASQISILENLHGILSRYLDDSREMEQRWRDKIGKAAAEK